MDICSCGKEKDIRSKTCYDCYVNPHLMKFTKFCNGCKQDLPIELYRLKHNKSRPRSRCKKCEARMARETRLKMSPEEKRIKKREYYHKDLKKTRKSIQKRSWKRMGFDVITMETLFNSHNNKCDCCGYETKTLVTDHCHSTGKFRGFLCSQCNSGLGLFKDNPIRLQSAIKYLLLSTPSSFGGANWSYTI